MKKEIKILLYPEYIELEGESLRSPRLLWILRSLNISPAGIRWGGDISSVVHEEPLIVRASSMIFPRLINREAPFCQMWPREGKWCSKKGYFLFYHDSYIGTDGICDYELLVPKFLEFLSRFLSFDPAVIDLENMEKDEDVIWAKQFFQKTKERGRNRALGPA